MRMNDGDNVNPWVNGAWRRVFELVSGSWRPLIPCGTEGDDGYLVNHNDIKVLPHYDRNYGYKWSVLIRRTKRKPAIERALLAYSLRLNSGKGAGSVFDSPSIPTEGFLPSADDNDVTYARVTRRIEPSWEFALEST